MTPEQQAARVTAVALAIAHARRARGVWAPFEALNPDQQKPLLGEAADLIAGVEAMDPPLLELVVAERPALPPAAPLDALDMLSVCLNSEADLCLRSEGGVQTGLLLQRIARIAAGAAAVVRRGDIVGTPSPAAANSAVVQVGEVRVFVPAQADAVQARAVAAALLAAADKLEVTAQPIGLRCRHCGTEQTPENARGNCTSSPTSLNHEWRRSPEPQASPGPQAGRA